MKTMSPRSQSDTGSIVPSDLGRLSEDAFRAIVNADLRRRVQPNGISERTSAALRSPAHVRRWHATLKAMLRSVQGQLAAGESDFEAQKAAIDSELDQIRDCGEFVSRARQLREETTDLRADYLRRRASIERFKCGLEEHLTVAESLVEGERDELFGSVVAMERDHYARRLRRVLRAVRDHQDAVNRCLADDEEPEPYELALWKALEEHDD